MNIVHYTTEAGYDPFQNWLDSLNDARIRLSILRRIDRASQGNFGNHKPCRGGVSEMRLDIRPGYRVYYFQHGMTIIVILCGGKKDTQTDDISKAISYREDYLCRLAKE